MFLKKYCFLLIYGLWHSSFIFGEVMIQGLPQVCTLVTMKKTVQNNALKSIDILFKNKASNHYFVHVPVAIFQNQNPTIQAKTTTATFFGDSITNNSSRHIALKNQLLLNVDPLHILQNTNQHKAHKEMPIIKLYNDQFYIATQSTYPTIRFWNTNPGNGNQLENIKEISKSFLVNYKDNNAVWAKKQIFNKNMLDIYIGFDFGPHSQSFLLKKDVYDFAIDKNVFSVPLIKDSFLPACWIEGNQIAIYNDRYKKIDFFQYVTTTNNNKTEHTITLDKTVILAKISHQDININNLLLYKTPFKIDYDNHNNKVVLVYDYFIIQINLNDNTFSIVIKSYNYAFIVDAIIDNHKDIYVLWHNVQYNSWQIEKYVIQ